jgi:hypothetical protein
MTDRVRIVINGYTRRYVTDTTELTTNRREAAVFGSDDMPKLNSFMAFLEPMYQDRIDLEPDNRW